MYVSRLTFFTHPGKTQEVVQHLQALHTWVGEVGGEQPQILRNHFASPGAPDVVFEQHAPDLATLEAQMAQVTGRATFQQWSTQMAPLLAHSPKREIYLVELP
ncbi:MAG: hypothetical protein AB7N91_15350 [Candidatus Tectimicrobiota bacterium]